MDRIDFDISLILKYFGSFVSINMIKDMTIKEIEDLITKIGESNEK